MKDTADYWRRSTIGRRVEMGRLKDLRKYVDNELAKMPDADKRNSAVVHLYGVSLAAAIIAKKRGENAELAQMAAMLHDLYAYEK